MAQQDDTLDKLTLALRRRFGASARVENIVIPTLGGSNRTLIFDVVGGAARQRLVSRQETYVEEPSPFLSPEAQFRIMRFAFEHGFPAPEPVLLFEPGDGLGRGFVTAYVAGETMPKRLLTSPDLAEARGRLTLQTAELLAQLHAMPVAALGFLAAQQDSIDPIAAQRALYESYGEPHPAIELGLRWLERNRPPKRAPVLVHGDFRTGNFMVGPAGVTAVLDWECAHLGARFEDLGWLCTRSWRFSKPELPVGGFGHRTPFFRAYAAASGVAVEPEEVRYWEICGLTRWAILNVMQAHGHVTGRRKGVVFAACGRNTSLCEYDLLMTLKGHYD